MSHHTVTAEVIDNIEEKWDEYIKTFQANNEHDLVFLNRNVAFPVRDIKYIVRDCESNYPKPHILIATSALTVILIFKNQQD